MKNLEIKKTCCINCKRFYSFNNNEQILCKYYNKIIQDIYVPSFIDIEKEFCSNFIENK